MYFMNGGDKNMTLANRITILRILLVPVFVIFVTYGYYKSMLMFQYAALGVFIFCILTDALDGFIARTFNQQTSLGIFLDPLADKLLLVSAFIFLGLSFVNKIPLWVSMLVVGREFIILIGWLVVYLFSTKKNNLNPSILGKMTTFFQMITILLCLINLPYQYLRWIIFLTVAVTIISTVDYILRGSKKLSSC
ncbi:CDP-diacylglycerol--glycerol-3-phosphate 3-phosphatidyltransferase [Candidatus Desantisbacteria bacterium CG_4_9_14_3_um_filter_40_11]|uniref:CDP-diacylglycerol--glycerol-3-phosphate 3-phosphatidyltransferase n=5 Tax=unclassified Candidatus Desantisiibacteriota TaxID=3106372 RepID=A0A2M7JDG6_9BACT|nr:MAG: CDP-diacylglycerol--glycerol-3-phosphate 3-phosphatidyltransferase [Candidatus Desantisbacteria bacterium CG23_combo_of_CG06-09_8_20_14_all_40_23]PIX17448.1 MAG: CDP-diacylglycerol--glycerol-3-phosphate 3-phosphatidyltransferase [Candidatus Desantisbacteria bacterium CG_4_8_14_3_um_filter_40_12]PIY19645.1 MAG: CDP-diacylglycerol--glycerol-3-phosphate 3-phosphatidyltransferase [Candidatus Desantisbacteria bacterium CG_4_10_14_3_um_filter_40_18]PJB30377.1 MAG: CDP-diacylglycerol--glycerol-